MMNGYILFTTSLKMNKLQIKYNGMKKVAFKDGTTIIQTLPE